MTNRDKNEQPHRRVILNNDGSPRTLHDRVPVGWDTIIEENVAVLTRTHIDTLFWCVGTNVFGYDTKVGELFGSDVEKFSTSAQWRLHENLKSLINGGRDLLKGIVEEGHNAGLEVFASFRMNDIHDSLYPEGIGSFKKRHPEFLLGDSVAVYEMGKPHKFHTRLTFNYAIAEVRAFWLGVISEVLDRYDVDGIELDWTRHPWAFKPGEELQNLGIMNEFTRDVRRHLDKTAEQRGRRLFLAVSAPSTFEECLQIGLDVATWLADGLVDILIAGGPPFDLRLRKVREATQKVGCQLFSRIINNRNLFVTPDVLRAAVSRHYADGVDGIYLFNFYGDPHRGLVDTIGDPQALERLDKHYIVAKRADPLPPTVHSTRRPTVPSEPLPVALMVTSGEVGQRVPLKVADDLKSAAADGRLKEVKLKLKLENLCPEADEVEFRLNGVLLRDYALVDEIHSCQFEFSLDSSHLKQGENALEVILRKRNPRVRDNPVLSDVEVFIKYKDGS